MKYSVILNKNIDMRLLMKAPFDMDRGKDDIVGELDKLCNLEEVHRTIFDDEDSFFTVSPDVEEIEIFFTEEYVIIRAYTGIMQDNDITDSGDGLFFIKNNMLEKFVYKAI